MRSPCSLSRLALVLLLAPAALPSASAAGPGRGPGAARLRRERGRRLHERPLHAERRGSRALEACARLDSAALIAEVVPGPAAGFVRVQTLDASGVFAGAPLFVARGGGAWSLAGTAEVDGDGLQDLVFEGAEGTPAEPFGKIEIAAGERAGSAIFLGLGGGTFSFAAKGDVDADGDEDLVRESGEHGALRIDLAEGADAPTPHVRASGGFSVAAVGDATGDGKADLVLEQGAAAKLQPLDGAFFLGPLFVPTRGGAFAPRLLADADANGTEDLVLVGPEGTRLLLMSPSRLAVLDRALLDTDDFPPVLAGDLDGDGDDDLVREGASGVRLLLLEGPSARPPALAFPPTPDGFRLVR